MSILLCIVLSQTWTNQQIAKMSVTKEVVIINTTDYYYNKCIW